MKKFLIFSLVILAGYVVSAATVHYVDEKNDRFVKFIAQDLARCLTAVSGEKYEAKTTGAKVKGDIVFAIDPKMQEQEWRLATRNGILYVEGKDLPGIAYGVYNFLEKYAGCLWLDPETEILPSKPGWKIPQINETGKPALWRREFYVAEYFNPIWRLRNRENVRANINFNYGSPRDNHTFSYYITKIKNPKLFKVAKNGGKCVTLCMTDPEVRRIVLDELIKNIEKDRKAKIPSYNIPKIYDISQLDGQSSGECWCKDCRELAEREGSYSGPNLDFVNYLAREIAKKYPDVYLSTFAYSYTTVPPKTLKAEKNVIIRFCSAWLFNPLVEGTPQGKMMEEWKSKTDIMSVWSYWTTTKGTLFPQVKRRIDMQREIRFCDKMNVKVYFAQAGSPLIRTFGMLEHWVFLKLMEDPRRDVFKLTETFMKGYYGKAAPAMLKYLDYLEKRQTEDRSFLDRQFYETVNNYLDEAEKLARGDEKSLLHVRFERVFVDRSMFENLAKLQKQGYKPDLKKISKRFAENGSNFVRQWSSFKYRPALRDKYLKKFEMERELFSHYPVAIPKQFDGCEVIDMHWSQLNVSGIGNAGFGCTFIKDPDAVCGTAFYNYGLKPKAPYNIGFYNSALKTGGGITLNPQEIPQDEKFHLYKLGNPTIMAPLYIVLDDSWHFRIWLATVGIVPEKWDIWISMKFTGPRFVPGSKQPNRVLFDRVLLVQDPNPMRHYKTVDPKKNLVKNPGFETGNGGFIAGWGRGNKNCMYDNTVKHSGKASLKIGNKTDGYTFIATHLSDFDKLNTDLLIRGWYRYENISETNHPFIGLAILTKEGRNAYFKSLATFYPGTYDWQRFETVIRAEDLKRAASRGKLKPHRVTLRISVGKQPGWVWLDDVEVIPLEKK